LKIHKTLVLCDILYCIETLVLRENSDYVREFENKALLRIFGPGHCFFFNWRVGAESTGNGFQHLFFYKRSFNLTSGLY
jgi:hypothetical protein